MNGKTSPSERRLHFELLLVERESHFKIKNLRVLLLAMLIYLLAFPVVIQKQLRYVFETQFETLLNTNSSNKTDVEAMIRNYEKGCLTLKPGFFSVDLVAHPFSALLIIIYFLTSKRRSLAPDGFLNGRLGFPELMSPFSKTRRFVNSLVYCLIAHEIYKVISKIIFTKDSSTSFLDKFYDPTGLVKFILKIVEVLISALRFPIKS